jgi:hypothetical protein
MIRQPVHDPLSVASLTIVPLTASRN